MDTPGFGMQIGLCNSIFNVEGGIHIDYMNKYVSGVIKGLIDPGRKTTAERAIRKEY